MKTKQPWDERIIKDDIANGRTAGEVVHTYNRPSRAPTVNITKNRNGYTWEITYQGESSEETLAVIRAINAQLMMEYGEK
jgi:hypothetical protein